MTMSTSDWKPPAGIKDTFPGPKYFALEAVDDGAYKKHLPTVTAVFIGSDVSPKSSDLMKIEGGMVEPDDKVENQVQLHLFFPTGDEDYDVPTSPQTFSEVCTFELPAEKEIVDLFLDNVSKVKAFNFAVSTVDYYFSCRINPDTTEVSEINCTYRALH